MRVIKVNLKLSGIAAMTGFILSLLVGLASGGGFPVSLLRALVCALVFFGLSYGIWALINRFLPELLQPSAVAGDDGLVPEEEAGSHVDISVDDGDDTIPDGAVSPEEGGSENDLGNISDLISQDDGTPFAGPVSAVRPAVNRDFPWEPLIPEEVPPESLSSDVPDVGMDQNNKESYTKGGSDSLPGKGASSDFVPAPLPVTLSGAGFKAGAGFESLPDLDAMAGAFMSSEDAEEEGAAAVYPVERKPPGTKGKSMDGKLNSRELASAIQSILKKD